MLGGFPRPVHRGSPAWDTLGEEGPWYTGCPRHRGSLVQDVPGTEGPWCTSYPWHRGSPAPGAQRVPSVGRAWCGQSPVHGGVPSTEGPQCCAPHRGDAVGAAGSRGSPRTSTWRPGMPSRQARMEPSSQTSSCLISSVRPSAEPAAAASAPLLPTFLMVAMTGGRGGSAPHGISPGNWRGGVPPRPAHLGSGVACPAPAGQPAPARCRRSSR